MLNSRSLLMVAVAMLSVATAPHAVLGDNSFASLGRASPLLFFAPLFLVNGGVRGEEGSTTTCSADDNNCKAAESLTTDNGDVRCCFLEGSTVEVLGKGLVSMKDLQLMDRVLTGNDQGDKFQPVYAFGQKKKKSITSHKLIRIIIRATSDTTDSSTKTTTLDVPGEHIIFVVDDDSEKKNEKTTILKPLRADSLRVGDIVRLGENHPHYNDGGGKHATKVSKNGVVDNILETTTAVGDDDSFYYAPLTKDGTIVVDGILTSTYAAALSPPTTALNDGGSKDSNRVLNGERDAIHMFLRPLRVVCLLSPILGKLIPDSTGTHLYVSFGLILAEIYKRGGFGAMIVTVLFYLVFGSLQVIENVVFIYIPRVVIVSVSKFFTVFMPTAAFAVLNCFDALDYLLMRVPYGLVVIPICFMLVIGIVIYLIRNSRRRKLNKKE